jgi:four helix bundle protein
MRGREREREREREHGQSEQLGRRCSRCRKSEAKTALHYEKLDVYQVSIQFVAVAVALSGQLPKGYASLADQLRRAAWSIPLNIAEGVGKPSPSDQARFHAIARGSAMECGAILDVARVLRVSSPQELMSAKQLIVRVVEMLTKLSR